MLEFKRLRNCRSFTALSGVSALVYGHLHDVWIVLAGQITPELVREAERQGADIWSYSERLRLTNLRANRYYAGLYTWSLGLKGNTVYSYGHYVFQPKAGAGANDPVWLPDHQRHSLDMVNGYALPGPQGPVPGIGLEGRREGTDDYRYLQLLEARLAAADASSPVVREARSWLNALRKDLLAEVYQGVFAAGYQFLWELDWVEPSSQIAPQQYKTIRETAADYIGQLASAEGERNEPAARSDVLTDGWEGEPYADRTVAEAVAALQQGSEAEQRAAATALILKEVDDDDVTTVTAALVDVLDQAAVRLPALRAIAALGPRAAAATVAVERQLAAEDPIVRCAAIMALGAIGSDAVDALAVALDDPFLENIGRAAECLSRIGPDARAAIPALQRAAKSSNEAIQVAINSAIEQIQAAGE